MAHPTEDALERFALDQSTNLELEEVESHILCCPSCLDRIQELETFIQTFRVAAPAIRAERAARPSGLLSRLGQWIGFNPPSTQIWKVAPALALLALVAVVVPQLRQPAGTRFDATLSATRGTETVTSVPHDRPVSFHLDTIDLSPGPYQAEIVDSNGRPVWSGVAGTQTNQALIETGHLEKGTYFVRIYSRRERQAENNQLLREFAFQVN